MIVSKDDLKWQVNQQAARIAELSKAVGLLTTLKPDMEIDANNPVNMATQIVAHVDARIAELEAESKARLTDASTAWDLCETLRARIAELEAAGNLVVEWWLTEGMKVMNGAPYAMFKLRAALRNTK